MGYVKKDFCTALAMAFGIEGAERVERQPISYSYNGVILPKLPEWDREKYPYAVLVRYGTSTIPFLWCDDTEFGVDSNGQATLYGTFKTFKLTDGEWVNHGTGGFGYTPFWTNTDLYYYESAGGGLFLEASEPIPVYE